MAETIVVAAALAQRPNRGGHAWVVLQYLLGFRRLGYDVVFVDKLDPGMCTDESGLACAVEVSRQYRFLHDLMRRFGLEEHFALLVDGGMGFQPVDAELGRTGSPSYSRCMGMSRVRLEERLRGSAMLLNVMGYVNDEALLALAPKRVFLDIDPGFGQMWRALGWADIFRNHDAFLTVGLNLGNVGWTSSPSMQNSERGGRRDGLEVHPTCAVPDCGIRWIPTRPPVVLEHWPVAPPPAKMEFTSVVSWRGAFAPIEYLGKTYGLRCHEFRRFAGLPQATGRHFRLALDIHPDESRDLALLESNGWTLDNPAAVVYDPWSYRDYIARSAAEFMVAKNMYVQARTGWFSDRTACYLASGRPAVAQDTGLPADLRVDHGLLLFSTPEEAAAAVQAVAADYETHARAARRLAEEQFESDIVLRQLLQNVSIL